MDQTSNIENKLSIRDLLSVCPFSERAVKHWLARYKDRGMAGLLDESTRPHHSPNRTPDWKREEILRIRDEDRLGGKKIFWRLQGRGIDISERSINNILRREGRTRKYTPKREYIYRHEPVTTPGELVEVDIKYGIDFGFNRWWYQYTAIDVASRWRFLRGYENKENDYSLNFLSSLMERTKSLFKIRAIKTDNDAVFTNRLTGYEKSSDPLNPRLHEVDEWCNKHGIVHYLISPGKPTQNGYVERSHRSDQEYFYDDLKMPETVEEYNYQLALWNNWYNDLPHCSLGGLSPNQYLMRVQNVLA